MLKDLRINIGKEAIGENIGNSITKIVRLLIILLVIILQGFSVFGQTTTTFTATLSAASSWNGVVWVKTGGASNATYPGQTGYAGENAGDIHIVVINTFDATARTLTLNIASVSSHISDITINNAPGIATLAIGNNSLTISGNLTGAGTLTFGTGTLSIAGNNTHTGTFTIGTGTIIYNGANQTIRDVNHYNITLSGSGTKTLTVTAARTANILSIDANTTLLLNGNNTLTPASASINGNVTNQNSASLVKGAGVINFNSGSIYEHGRNGASITTATWNNGSTCLISGITNTLPTVLNQNFYNFTWNCSGQTALLNFNGALTNIVNNFTIQSTGSGSILLLPTSGQSIAIGGDFSISGGTLYPVNIAGRTVTINLSGNFNQTGGSLLNPNGTCSIIFQKAGTQTFTQTGTLTGNVNFTINSGTILDMGTSAATGSGTFTVNNGGTLQTANIDGISAAGATGSVQTTTRVFNTGANYTYNGTSAQTTGSGLPATANNLTINNASGVSLTNAVSVNGILTLSSGSLTLGSNNLTIAATGSVAGSFGNTCLILTEGTGAFTKTANTVNDLIMTYPVGSTGKYTPMVISGAVGGSGSGSLSVRAIAGNQPNAVAGTLALSKYWEVRTAGITLNAGNVAFTYHGSEALSDPTAFTAMFYSLPAATWSNPTSSIIPPTITTSLSSSINGDWTATARLTLYSYQTGNWSTANTWTTDPSGNELSGSRVPQNGDKVVILQDRIVTLTADVSTTNNNLTVAEGGILDMDNYRFTNTLASIDGNGKIKTKYVSGSVGYFPAAITNTFVNAGGGTYEYNCTADFNLPTQSQYNNLRIYNSSGIKAIQTSDLTINGNLSVDRGTFQINDGTARTLNLTVLGNVSVASTGTIATGTGNTGTTVATPPTAYHSNAHQFVIYGDFTNTGTVKFTNLAAPDYATFPATGFVTVRFTGATDNTVTLNNTSWFYNLIIDKGSDKSNILEINANNANNFILFGKNDVGRNETAPYSAENPEVRKALWIKNGTLKLAGKINIPTLSEGNTVSGNGDYTIGINGKLWISSPDAYVYSTASAAGQIPVGAAGLNAGSSNQALSLYGAFQLTDGYFSTRNSAGFIFWNTATSTPDVIIEGGSADLSVFRSAGAGGKGTYNQSGGTFTVRGNSAALPGEVDGNFPLFGIMDPTCSFTMTGGTLVLTNNSGHGAPEYNGLYITSSAGNYSVTGGKVSIQLTSTIANNIDINVTSNLWNLDILSLSGAVATNLRSNLIVNGSLLIGDNATLTSNNFNLSVGQNFTLGQTAGTNTAVYTPGTNTTSFIGASNSNITVTNTGTTSPLNFNNLTVNKDVSTASATFVSTGRAAGSSVSTVNSLLSVNSGILDYSTFYLRASGNIYNAGTLGPNASTGRLFLNGGAQQTITTSSLTTHSIGYMEINNTGGAVLAGDETINNLVLTSNNQFQIGASLLTIGSGGLTGGAFSVTRCIYTNGLSSAGGLKRYISNANNGQTLTYPIATAKGYTPARIIVTTVTANGYLTAKPVNAQHPTVDPTKLADALDYYWKIIATGLAGTVTYQFDYSSATIDVNHWDWRFVNNAWIGGANANVGTQTLTFPGVTTFDSGDFTSGKNSPFRNPATFYSKASANWNVLSTWSTVSHSGANATALPQAYDNIEIGDGATYNHTVTVPTGYTVSSAIAVINTGSTLDFGTTTNASTQTLDVVSGQGKIKISSSAATAVFPTGDFGAFLGSSGGTVEYYSTGTQDFDLPTNITSYKNLTFTPSTGRWIAIPNIDARVYGDFTVQGVGTGSGWGNWYGTTRNFIIDGNFNVTSAYFHVYNNVQQNIVVQGNLNISSGASFDGLWNVGVGTPSTHSLTLYGNLTNNGTIDITTWNKVNITFAGSNNNLFTGTNGSASTILNNVTINKGISQATTLTFSTAGFISVPTTNWLTLQNGSFIIDNTTINIPISNGSVDFSIPSTTALIVRNGKASINATGGTKGIYLDGLLKLENASQLLVGDSTSVNGQYIEYSTSGNAQIDISGTSLLSVNAQIRRSTISTQGILKYNQTGGNIRIHGIGANTTRAKFEVTNTGSIFNQTGGNISVLRGSGGSTYGDIYIRPASSSTSGGSILLAPTSSSAAAESFKVDATVALYNLYVSGISGHTANVTLNISPLSLNGNLNINAYGTFNTNNLNLSLKGDFINSGTFSSGTTDVTTFNGTVAQKLYGNATYATTFSNLALSSTASVTLQTNSNITVNNTLSILSGTLDDGGNTITAKGNLVNYTTHISSGGTGGIKFQGTTNQTISGDGTSNNAVFGRIEVDNTADVKLLQNAIINNAIVFTNGSMNIDDHLLSIAQGATFSAPSGFGITRMIYTNGKITTSQGVKIYIPTGISDITCPVGVLGKYTPVEISTSTNIGAGSSVIFNPINAYHPTALDASNVLQYYWIITSSGLSNYTGSLNFSYANADVATTVPNAETDYISGRLYSNSWTKLPNTYVDEVSDIIQFPFSSSTSDIGGEYSAGIDAALPTNVPVFYSTGNDNWDNASAWSPTPVSGVPSGAIMVIQNGHTITINTDSKVAYKTTIDGKVSIASGSVGHYFGVVDGTGTLSVTSNTASVKLPAGSYTSFFSCIGGSLEYGGTGSYILSNIPTTLRKLILIGSGTKTLPNKNISICELLDLQGTTILDNSANNVTMTINGNMTRASGATFTSGTGTLIFNGVTAQSIGDFSGINAFNNLTINNAAGITLTGPVDMSGNLTLTSGNVTTTSTNILYMTNGSSTVTPTGGKATSYINGPMKKRIIGGAIFEFPLGKASRYGKLKINQGNDGDWTMEYFNTGKTPTPTVLAPIVAGSTTEYWSVTGPSASNQAYITTRWDPESDIRPAVTTNGITDMRIGELNASTQWSEILTSTTGDNSNGTQTSSAKITLPAGSPYTKYYTNACINPVKPRARFSSTTAVCAGSTIPVEFTGSGATPYTLSYSINGVDQTDLTGIMTSTTTITSTTAGTYLLNGFTYNGTAGLYDITTVTVNALPTTSNAGPNQSGVSMCGRTSATLAANTPIVGTGTWSIVSGTGGVITSINSPTSAFNGTAGTTYVLRWTISTTSCTASTSDVTIEFRQSPPLILTSNDADNTFCAGTNVTFTASPLVGTSTYNFRVNAGSVQNSAANTWASTTLTNGQIVDVIVLATNGCSATSVGITNTVNPNPTITLGANPSIILGTTTANLTYSATSNSPDQYSINFDATAEGQGFSDVGNSVLPATPIVITVPAAPSPSTYNGLLWVTKSTTGCYSPNYNISVIVNPPSSVTMTATSATTICLGDNVTLRFTLTGTSPWSVTYNGTTINGILTSPHDIIVSPSPVGTVNYTVTAVSDASLLPGTINAPATIAVTVNPKPGSGPMYKLPNQ